MQGKLTLTGKLSDWKKKVESAAHFSGVEVLDSAEMLGEVTFELASRSFEKIVKFGRLLDKVDGTEKDAADARKKAKEAAKK